MQRRAVQVRTVRPVNDERLILRLHQFCDRSEVRKKSVIVGRSEDQRVCRFHGVPHSFDGRLPRDSAGKLLRNGNEFQPHERTAAQNTDVRADGNGKLPHPGVPQRHEHRINAARAAVRQQKTRIRPQYVRYVRLRLSYDAGRRGKIIRIRQLCDVRSPFFMPRRMKGNMFAPLLCGKHVCKIKLHSSR